MPPAQLQCLLAALLAQPFRFPSLSEVVSTWRSESRGCADAKGHQFLCGLPSHAIEGLFEIGD